MTRRRRTSAKATIHHWERHICGDLRDLPGVRQEVDDLLHGIPDLHDATIAEILLAVTEALTNVMRHAAHDVATDGIHLTLDRTPHQLRVVLSYHGMPFDRASIPEPDLDTPRERGYGLYIIEHLMDEVAYRTTASGLEVILVKMLPEGGEK